MPAHQLFKYRPFSSPDSQIRLLYLLPGRSFDIQIALEAVEFINGASLQYEALSYTSGSQEDSANLVIEGIDGGELSVTRNPNEALSYLSLRDASRVLWVDAICINQNDLDERSRQLTLMA